MSTNQGCSNETEIDDRPRALRNAEHARAIEQMIMDALPNIITKLVSMAEEGNVAAARYLVDRIHGRPARVAAPPTMDTSLTYTRQDWTADTMCRKAHNDDRKRVALSIISRCAPPNRRQ